MQSSDELAEALYLRVRELARLVRAEATGELSVTAASVLLRLRESGATRVTDLAAAENVAQPTMTTLLRRLEARGLVARGSDPDDARAVRVSVTATGLETLAAVAAARTRIIAERLETLDAAARDRIAAALPDLDAVVR